MHLWIDTDCGVDDSTAILLCLDHPNIDIVGISCIGGNVSCEQVTKNVRRTIKVYDSKLSIPIFQGCERGLVSEPMHVPFIHGNDGLGDIDLDSFGICDIPPIMTENSVFALIKAIREYPDLTILTLGPLTNLALAIRIDPGIIPLISSLYIMGGAEDCVGNMTPYAEFNFVCDPESAHIVFSSVPKSRITLSTWTLTKTHGLKGEILQEIFHKDTSKLQRWMAATWSNVIKYDENQALMADPIAAFLAINGKDAIEETEPMDVQIVLNGEKRGATLCTPIKDGVNIVKRINFGLFTEAIQKLFKH